MKITNLQTVAYAGKWTLHYYDAADQDVDAPGYFSGAYERLKRGDLMIVSRKGPMTRFYTVMRSDRENGVEVRQMNKEHLSPLFERSPAAEPEEKVLLRKNQPQPKGKKMSEEKTEKPQDEAAKTEQKPGEASGEQGQAAA